MLLCCCWHCCCHTCEAVLSLMLLCSFIVTPVAPVHDCNRSCLFSAPFMHGSANHCCGMKSDQNSTVHTHSVLVPACCQVNMYQGGGWPAASSYKTYLTSDAAPGRPDGYGLREWKHDTSGALWSVSAVLQMVLMNACMMVLRSTAVHAVHVVHRYCK